MDISQGCLYIIIKRIFSYTASSLFLCVNDLKNWKRYDLIASVYKCSFVLMYTRRYSLYRDVCIYMKPIYLEYFTLSILTQRRVVVRKRDKKKLDHHNNNNSWWRQPTYMRHNAVHGRFLAYIKSKYAVDRCPVSHYKMCEDFSYRGIFEFLRKNIIALEGKTNFMHIMEEECFLSILSLEFFV